MCLSQNGYLITEESFVDVDVDVPSGLSGLESRSEYDNEEPVRRHGEDSQGESHKKKKKKEKKKEKEKSHSSTLGGDSSLYSGTPELAQQQEKSEQQLGKVDQQRGELESRELREQLGKVEKRQKLEKMGEELGSQQKMELENSLLRAQVQQLEEDRTKEREQQWFKEAPKTAVSKSAKQLYEQRGELREEMERLRRECSLADAVVKTINARSPQSMTRQEREPTPATGYIPFSATVTGLRGIISPPNVAPQSVPSSVYLTPASAPESTLSEKKEKKNKKKSEANEDDDDGEPTTSVPATGSHHVAMSGSLSWVENGVSRKEHDELLSQFEKQKELLNSWDDVVERIFPLMHQLLLLPESASAQRQASICEHLLRENRHRMGTPKAVLQIIESLTEALALWQQDTRDKIIMLEASLNAVKMTNQEDLELVYDSMKRKTDRLVQFNNIEQENINLRDKLFVAERKMSLQQSLQVFGGINRQQPNPSKKTFAKNSMKQRGSSPERFRSRMRDDVRPLYVIPDRPARKTKSTAAPTSTTTQRIEQPSAEECFDSDSIYR